MTTSYSDQILMALAKHGRLNCQQLANKISHDSKKTTQLVSFMRTNKKVKTDGQIDGLAAYSLTELGLALVPAAAPHTDTANARPLGSRQTDRVRNHVPAPRPSDSATLAGSNQAAPERESASAQRSSPPSSLDDLAEAQMRPATRGTDGPKTADPWPVPVSDLQRRLLPAAEPAPAFGLLNTGEFLIIADGHTIKIPAEYVPVMRAQLGRVTAGAFQ